MLSSLLLIGMLGQVGAPPALESVCQQVAPVIADGKWSRTIGRSQAVVLIHGFHYHALPTNVPKAEFRPWQKADTPLVKELGKQADVYVFAYGQNAPLDVVVRESKLAVTVASLRKMGYDDIVLMGHSAGGLIARHFVEDFPNAGVTKVVQICAPNGGSALASVVVPKNQKAFLECLTEKNRQICLKERAGKAIPDNVHFFCVVAKEGGKVTDGVVNCVSQWTADLQAQGIPAITVTGGHRDVVRDPKTAETLSRLIREPYARWPAERIDQAKIEIFGAPLLRPATPVFPRIVGKPATKP